MQRLLFDWEKESGKVKTFECKFDRLEFDTFDPTGQRKPNQPVAVDRGEIKYSAPDKAMFQVRDNKGDAVEFFVCDGEAIYEQDPIKRQMIIHKLPPERRGKAIADGPVPFLFGAKAAKLVERYYMKIIPPEEIKPEFRKPNEVWLEAWPRHMADAQNFKYAEMILAKDKNLTPTDVRIHHPNGNHYVVYRLNSIAVNKRDMLGAIPRVFEDPWWHPRAPSGWKTVVDDPLQASPAAQPPMGRQTPPTVGSRFQQPR